MERLIYCREPKGLKIETEAAAAFQDIRTPFLPFNQRFLISMQEGTMGRWTLKK
jgi:hypothetical protein